MKQFNIRVRIRPPKHLTTKRQLRGWYIEVLGWIPISYKISRPYFYLDHYYKLPKIHIICFGMIGISHANSVDETTFKRP
jgi:hypothetical protein